MIPGRGNGAVSTPSGSPSGSLPSRSIGRGRGFMAYQMGLVPFIPGCHQPSKVHIEERPTAIAPQVPVGRGIHEKYARIRERLRSGVSQTPDLKSDFPKEEPSPQPQVLTFPSHTNPPYSVRKEVKEKDLKTDIPKDEPSPQPQVLTLPSHTNPPYSVRKEVKEKGCHQPSKVHIEERPTATAPQVPVGRGIHEKYARIRERLRSGVSQTPDLKSDFPKEEPSPQPQVLTLPSHTNPPYSVRKEVKEKANGVSCPSLTEISRSISSLNLKDSQKPGIVAWFTNTVNRTITLEYLQTLVTEPTHNLESLIATFTPARKCLRNLEIQLAMVKVHVDQGCPSQALQIIKNVKTEKFERCDHLNELIQAYYYWITFIANTLGVTKDTKLETGQKPQDWANTYVKASFIQLFSTEGCQKALFLLQDISEDKLHINPQNRELLFLKARLLGKLRYLKRWPANRWQEEKDLLTLLKDNTTADSVEHCMYEMHTAEFYRLKGMRLRLESRNAGTYFREARQCATHFELSYDILMSLFDKLKDLGEQADVVSAMAWHSEQLFKTPTRGDWDDIPDKLALRSQKLCFDSNPNHAYMNRAAAYYMEKFANKISRERISEAQRQNQPVPKKRTLSPTEKKEEESYLDQAIAHLDVAISQGSSMALLERAGLQYRRNPRQTPLQLRQTLSQLPDKPLHEASYLWLVKNDKRAAKACIEPILKDHDKYPPLVVHYPIWFPLQEPINLADAVCREDSAGCTNPDGYLLNRNDIIMESYRLKTNRREKKITKEQIIRGQLR